MLLKVADILPSLNVSVFCSLSFRSGPSDLSCCPTFWDHKSTSPNWDSKFQWRLSELEGENAWWYAKSAFQQNVMSFIFRTNTQTCRGRKWFCIKFIGRGGSKTRSLRYHNSRQFRTQPFAHSRISRKRTASGGRNSVRNWSWPLTRMSKYKVCMGARGFVKAAVGRAVRLRECPLRELWLYLENFL